MTYPSRIPRDELPDDWDRRIRQWMIRRGESQIPLSIAARMLRVKRSLIVGEESSLIAAVRTHGGWAVRILR